MKNKVTTKLIEEAYKRLQPVVKLTPLQHNKELSERYEAEVYLKREDLQPVRSYKLRGAYNCIAHLAEHGKGEEIVCASAGNHAQGVAFACTRLKIKGFIYMPANTPKQKVERVRKIGGQWTSIKLVGDTYDEAFKEAKKFCDGSGGIFVHPFDDALVIAGQGTVGLEFLSQIQKKIDYVFLPVGGGGLLAGAGTYLKEKTPGTKIIAVEPLGAPSMKRALEAGKAVTLDKIDTFIDGASVRTVGKLTFEIARTVVDKVVLVDEGKVCTEMISLYQNNGIVTEPAGALSIAALDVCKHLIKGKTVVCVVSGGNNDISRYPEIIERSLVYRGLKHYFIIEFSQRPGSLRNYLDNVLGERDDITLFEYIKKNNKETGPALVGVELSEASDLKSLILRMDENKIKYKKLDSTEEIYKLLV